MTRKRRNFTPEFKSEVAIEALKEELTVAKLTKKFDLHPNMITNWKRQAIEKYGTTGIFNTDQGSRFTNFEFANTLKDAGIKISKDGRDRWMDNVFIERLLRPLKYECVYLNAFETGTKVREGIGKWINYCNETRPLSTFGGQTPREVYNQSTKAGNWPK